MCRIDETEATERTAKEAGEEKRKKEMKRLQNYVAEYTKGAACAPMEARAARLQARMAALARR